MNAVDRLRELREDPEYVKKEFDNLLRMEKESLKDSIFHNDPPLKFKNTPCGRINLHYTDNPLKSKL